MRLKVLEYQESFKEKWDQFVIQNSINGTFLQTRNFLNYHPESRFVDASLMIMQGSNIIAVIPACDIVDNGKHCFFSHKGSTFGGIVIGLDKYNISTMDELVPLIEEYLVNSGYKSVLLKCTSNIFCARNMDLLDYFLYKNGYNQFDEISLYVDVENAPNDLCAIMSGSRRRDYRYSLKNRLEFRKLETGEEILRFYEILCSNLEKFEVKPVHTFEELIEFRTDRLRDYVDFYGVFYQNKIIAGTMLFFFKKQVLHTQYLAQDMKYSELFTMNYLDYKLIELTREKGFSKYSFGISTEDRGKVLNKGLALFKEGFGCDYCVNRSYIKDFEL